MAAWYYAPGVERGAACVLLYGAGGFDFDPGFSDECAAGGDRDAGDGVLFPVFPGGGELLRRCDVRASAGTAEAGADCDFSGAASADGRGGDVFAELLQPGYD